MITNPSTTTSAPAPGATRKASPSAESATNKLPRGFAAMEPAQQRRIASEGGRASHQSGRGHRFTPEEARAAGRKGGRASRGRNSLGTTAS